VTESGKAKARETSALRDSASREAPPDTALTFEEAMIRLEQIVAELQKEDVPLEKAFDLWEEGQRLHAHCKAILEGLKKRLEATLAARTGEEDEE